MTAMKTAVALFVPSCGLLLPFRGLFGLPFVLFSGFVFLLSGEKWREMKSYLDQLLIIL